MRWTKEEKEIVKQFYPIEGQECQKRLLSRTCFAVAIQARRLGVCTTKDVQIRNSNKARQNNRDIDRASFMESPNKETAYILGYLWADGCIHHHHGYKICLKIAKQDALDLVDMFKKYGDDWKFYTIKYKEKAHHKTQMMITVCDKPLYDFLHSLDYQSKDGRGPDKVLKFLPPHLHSFFLRGYFDGDGCIHVAPEKNGYYFSITSCGHQNWDFLLPYIKGFKTLRVHFDYGDNSKIYVQGRWNMVPFLDYIFSSGPLGLKRKYQKYLWLKKLGNEFPFGTKVVIS